MFKQNPFFLFLKKSILIEHQIVVKFHIKLEATATKTYFLLKEVDGNECSQHTHVFLCFTVSKMTDKMLKAIKFWVLHHDKPS